MFGEEQEIKHLIVMVTTPDKEQAITIARTLVSEKLCACVNIIDPITSIYTWKGKIEESGEALMLIKTKEELFGQLTARIKELHSYDVPEIIALPILAGNPSYLKWIDEVCGNYLID